MAKKFYALESGGPKCLTVSWKGFYKNITIELDGNELAAFLNKEDLVQGRSVALPDSSSLDIKLNKTWLYPNLQLLRDGKPLPGSSADPYYKLKLSYSMIFAIAILGAFGIFNRLSISIKKENGPLIILISFGVDIVFGVLGYFVKRRSIAALIIAIILFSIDIPFLFLSGKYIAGLVNIAILILMAQGIPAIKAIRAEKE